MVDTSKLRSEEVTFNQAQFQQLRLHEIMQNVNMCWSNFAGEVEGIPIYHILFENLSSYYLEVRANFTTTEQKSCDERLDKTELILNDNTIWNSNINVTMGRTNRSKVLNPKIYLIFRKMLRDFQKELFEYAKKHGFLNPTKADPGAAIIN